MGYSNRGFKAAALLAVVTLCNVIPSSAQISNPSHETKTSTLSALSRQALRDVARNGSLTSISAIKDQYGDAALPYFADARFAPDLRTRDAAMSVAGDTYNSLLFLLPLIEDPDANLVTNALSRITNLRRPSTQFQRLKAAEVVQSVKRALRKDPDLVRRSPDLLLLLSLFKNNAEARTFTRQLISAHKWNSSPSKITSVDWSHELTIALLARCENGTVTPAQVIDILNAHTSARAWFIGRINLIKDKMLLRYAISLLQNTTLLSPNAPEADDVGRPRVCDGALLCLSWATGIEIDYTVSNGRWCTIRNALNNYIRSSVCRCR